MALELTQFQSNPMNAYNYSCIVSSEVLTSTIQPPDGTGCACVVSTGLCVVPLNVPRACTGPCSKLEERTEREKGHGSPELLAVSFSLIHLNGARSFINNHRIWIIKAHGPTQKQKRSRICQERGFY